MTAYYNEVDPYAAAWLRSLIADGLIPSGDVDDRSIVEVRPGDLAGYVQCHFFAGIGGWAYAARLAGWPDDRPIWTGSCPCQPFSVAGKGGGRDDPRHLWPDFHRLIGSCRPAVVMGEQVAGKAGLGWFDGVRADLAGDGYTCRGVDIPALAVDAPHIRNRLYWVAVADPDQAGSLEFAPARLHGDWQPRNDADGCGRSQRGRDMGDAGRAGLSAPEQQAALGARRQGEGRAVAEPGRAQIPGDVEHSESAVERARLRQGGPLDDWSLSPDAGLRNGTFWSDAEWLVGADGKARRAQSGVRLLAHGVPGRVGQLRGYGNAIVPPLAVEVIAAFMES